MNRYLVTRIISTALFVSGLFITGVPSVSADDQYSVKLEFANKIAKTGSNDIHLLITDSNNNPVDADDVKIIADMDRSSSMSMDMSESKALDYHFAKNSAKTGEFTGNISFEFIGKWKLEVNFMTAGKKNTIIYTLDVVQAGPNWIFIGSFIGLIALVIIIGIIRKNSNKSKAQA